MCVPWGLYNSLLNIKQPIINILSVYWLFYNHVYCKDNISNPPLTSPSSAFIGLHFKSWPILNMYQSCSVCFGIPEETFVLEISIKGPNTHVRFEKGKGPKQKSPWSLTPAWTMPSLCQSQCGTNASHNDWTINVQHNTKETQKGLRNITHMNLQHCLHRMILITNLNTSSSCDVRSK